MAGKDKRMRILAINRYEEPVVKEIENTLEDMQRYVMGYIETVTLSGTAVLVCNEDGRLADFTPNRILKIGRNQEIQEVIRGDFFICGWAKDEFCDISNEDIEKYTKMFSKPEVFFMPVWAGTSRVWKPVAPEKEGDEFVFYELWQSDAAYAFSDSAYAFNKYKPNFSDYHKVYRGIIPLTEGFDARKACEQLYMEHNGVILDRKGRSMSISDIIIMDSPEGKRWFYVDTFGFTKVCFGNDGEMAKEEVC